MFNMSGSGAVQNLTCTEIIARDVLSLSRGIENYNVVPNTQAEYVNSDDDKIMHVEEDGFQVRGGRKIRSCDQIVVLNFHKPKSSRFYK